MFLVSAHVIRRVPFINPDYDIWILITQVFNKKWNAVVREFHLSQAVADSVAK